jgi:hypothetical protein
MNTISNAVRNVVVKAAKELLVANNTVTTLELKLKLIKDEPLVNWNQKLVSDTMNELYQDKMFTFVDNGTFRVYSAPKTTKAKVVKLTGKVVPISTPVANNNAIAKVATAPKVSVKPTVKPTGKNISRKVALQLIQNNKGHFFTAVFVKQDGTERKINAQYLKDQKDMSLGYVKVREASKLKTTPNDCTRNLNLQTLKSLKIAGAEYTIK